MKHTLGPWILTSDGEANFNGIATKDNWLFRIQQNGELRTEEQTANAKLIAAAPAMLKALQGVISHDDALVERYKISPSLIFHVEMAIKEAT